MSCNIFAGMATTQHNIFKGVATIQHNTFVGMATNKHEPYANSLYRYGYNLALFSCKCGHS